MMTPEAIKRVLSDFFSESTITVTGDGHHFEAVIVSSIFNDKTRIMRQRLVNDVLAKVIQTGELHAISMKLWTPAEWESKHG